MIEEFEAAFRESLSKGYSLDHFRNLLIKFRDRGLTREEARLVLEALRARYLDEDEDRILEVLDIVTGFCRPDWRIWNDQ